MKKVVNVGIGGKSFTIDEDAYQKLEAYLKAFKEKTGMGYQTNEVMEELELRIADLFTENLSNKNQDVIDIATVNDIIIRMGMPDGSPADGFESAPKGSGYSQDKPVKRFYRNPDMKTIGGVCGGLSAYFDIDVTIIRILFLIVLICGSLGFWIYVIFWIVAPLANTAVQKCEMHGLEPNAENIRKFTK